MYEYEFSIEAVKKGGTELATTEKVFANTFPEACDKLHERLAWVYLSYDVVYMLRRG